MNPQMTTCPECGAPAEVLDHFMLPSTDGLVEHIKARCVTGPWFAFPAPSASATEPQPTGRADLLERVRPQPSAVRRPTDVRRLTHTPKLDAHAPDWGPRR
jgi:hypothetical protein